MVFWGHAPNSQTRGLEMKRAFEKLDLLVVIDPYPTLSAVMHERQNDTYLLPACTQFETYGSVTSSNRSVQWRDKVIEPLFESKPDHVILYLLAKKLGLAEQLTKNIQVIGDEPLIEDILREINRGAWTIGYSGHSPERLKLHQQHWGDFDIATLKAMGGPCDGEYYGLPWPCWGKPEFKHPGTPILYDLSKPVAQGGLPFRARFGVEHEGVSLLAEGSYPKDSSIKNGYPEFTDRLLKKLGWWEDLSFEERQEAEGKDWKTDLSGGIQRVALMRGCAPCGNAKARCVAWDFPDPVPRHREPIYAKRRDLVAKYPTFPDRARFFRLPTRYASLQQIDFSRKFPLQMTSGRLVEYEGGGDETRSNPWLAELQREMFVELHPADANELGVRHGQRVWVEGPEGGRIQVMAFVTQRVPKGVVFMPFHFGGFWQGQDLKDRYPEGSVPYVRGESCNLIFTYGYDVVTMMQESKISLCRITPA
ncbi:MAG: formate dehydrogenase subunit alpha [Methylohalobius sp.]|nr:formate dehydrogenase subunit alpha [Methylohalobius sp.]